jgi:hypothetical protein
VVSVMGAEVMPLRAWQQGASLLDWGFSVTKGASVGHLVAPGEADKLLVTAEPSAPAVAPVAAAPATPTSEPLRGLVQVAVGAGVAAFAGIWVFALMLARRRRATHRQWRSPTADTTVVMPAVPSTVEPAAAAQPSTVEAETTATAATAVAVLDEPPPPVPPATPAPLMGQPPPPPEA